MVKPKAADSPLGPAELHENCNANRFEPQGSVGPYVFGVASSPTMDILEPGPSGSGPSVVHRDSGPEPEGHGSIGKRETHLYLPMPPEQSWPIRRRLA